MGTRPLAERLQRIDRRVLYILLAVVMIGPLFYKRHFLPTFVSQEARGMYEAVEAMLGDKVAVLVADYDTGTLGENQPQLEAVMRHLMRLGKRFAIVGMVPAGPELAQERAEALAEELGKEYGKDWVNWGFLAPPPGGEAIVLEALCRDIPGQVKKDIRGKPLDQVPAMAGVEDIHDVGLLVDFTGSGIWLLYVQLVYGPFKVPVGTGCTAVVGPETFPFLDSKQLAGLLFGMRGAAEYEEMNRHYDKGDRSMASLSFAHFLIILLIILGNIGYFWSRRQRGAS